MKKRHIGAHVSASGGHHKALKRAADLGANCLQLFSGSPRVWKRPDLQSVDADVFAAERKKHGIEHVFTHALYLVNLASDKQELLEKSRTALTFDLQFDAHISGSGVVVHLGSHQGRGWESSKDQVLDQIQRILAATPENSTFLIENSAGQNGKLCSDLAEIKWLLDRLDHNRVGWCVDTCHAFAAGYRLDGVTGADAQALTGELFESEQSLNTTITDLELWSTLKCIHVNDSRDPFSSGRDRHANLSEGMIPADHLQWFVNTPETQQIPLVLEVPGEGNGPDKINVNRLTDWVQ